MAVLTVVLSLGLLLASGLPGDTGVQADIPGDNVNPEKSDTDCLVSAKSKVNQCVSSFQAIGKQKEEACRLGSATVTCISDAETNCTAYTFKSHTQVPLEMMKKTVNAYCDGTPSGCAEKAHFDMLSCASQSPKDPSLSKEEKCRYHLAVANCVSAVLKSCEQSKLKDLIGLDFQTLQAALAAMCGTSINTGCATKTKSDIADCYQKVTTDGSASEVCSSKQAAVDCITAALNTCKETSFKALFKVDLQTAKSAFLAGCNTGSGGR